MTPAAAVHESPILFKGHLVRAIIAGTKTQTRRTRGLEVVNESPDDWQFDRWQRYPDGSVRAVFDHIPTGEPNAIGLRCPYGVPGDRLWVKENYAFGRGYDGVPPRDVAPDPYQRIAYAAEGPFPDWAGKLRPSIFMPRWASRLTLENTDVRAERIQDVTEEDVIAEGFDVPRCPKCGYTRWDCRFHMDHHLCGEPEPPSAIPTFCEGWDEINGRRGYGWDANLWCWCNTFRRIES